MLLHPKCDATTAWEVTINFFLFYTVHTHSANQTPNISYLTLTYIIYLYVYSIVYTVYVYQSLRCRISHDILHIPYGSHRRTKKKNTWHFVFAPFAFTSIFRSNRNIKNNSQIGSLASSSVCISGFCFFSSSSSSFSVSIFGYIWKRFRRQRWREIRDEIDQWCVNQTM